MKKLSCILIIALLTIPILSCSQEKETAPTKGSLAPSFMLTTLDGSSINLNDLRGKAVFTNFWRTECRYCQYEMPNIQKMHDTYASEGLVVLGVNVGDSQSNAEGYARRLKITFPILLDSDEKINAVYLVTGTPPPFLLTKKESLTASISEK